MVINLNVKQIFVKAPLRVETLKDAVLDCSLYGSFYDHENRWAALRLSNFQETHFQLSLPLITSSSELCTISSPTFPTILAPTSLLQWSRSLSFTNRPTYLAEKSSTYAYTSSGSLGRNYRWLPFFTWAPGAPFFYSKLLEEFLILKAGKKVPWGSGCWMDFGMHQAATLICERVSS